MRGMTDYGEGFTEDQASYLGRRASLKGKGSLMITTKDKDGNLIDVPLDRIRGNCYKFLIVDEVVKEEDI